jgi:acylglycerol lipase
VASEHKKWRFHDGRFKNALGQWLYYCSYFPPQDPDGTRLRGVVVFLHGIGKYARRFTHLFDVLCESGFGVVAYDLIGHGRSDDDECGERAHAQQFQHFVDDTNTFLKLVKQSVFPQMLQGPVPPLVLMGMSYGSLVGLHTVLSEQHAFAAVVLAAPALSVEWTTVLRFQRAVLTPVARFMPRARVTPGVNYAFLSRNPEFLQDYMADPMVIKGKLTVRMATETLAAMEKVQHDAQVVDGESAFCRMPLLLVQGSEDKITSVALADEFYQRVASKDKTFQKFDGLYHCLFNEPERETVTNYITNWLVTRFPSGEHEKSICA